MNAKRLTNWARIGVGASSLAFLVLHVLRFPGAGRDDVFITLWSGETLGQGSWFLNYNLEPQEMMTTVLGALIVAGLDALAPGAAYLLNKGVSLAAGLGVLIALWYGRSLLFGGRDAAGPALIAIVFTALSPALGYWSLSGLESSMVACLLVLHATALLAYTRERTPHTGIALVGVQLLLVLARAEGFWVVIATAGLLALAPGARWRDFWIIALPAAGFAVLLWMRIDATGLAWPNPVYAKTGSFEVTVPLGARYLIGYYTSGPIGLLQAAGVLGAVAILARAALGFVRRRNDSSPRFALTVVSAQIVAHELFVLLVGGNWMEYYRFMVPSLALKNLLVAAIAWPFLRRGLQWASAHSAGPPAVVASVAVILLLAAQQQRSDGRNPLTDKTNCSETLPLRAVHETLSEMTQGVSSLNCAQSRDRRTIEPFIEQRMRRFVPESRPLTVVSYQGGFFPYTVRRHFGPEEVRFIDTLGLINSEIAVLPVRKHHLGTYDGMRIDRILAGQAGALSDAVQLDGPTLIYLVKATEPERTGLASLGFRRVWESGRAVVFHRD